MTRTLRVEIIGDATRLQSGLRKAEGVTSSFASTLGKIGLAIGGAATAGYALEQVGQFAWHAAEGAGQLQKSMEAIRSTFGPSSKGVLAFGDAAAKLGISAAQADATSTKFGILFKNMGIGHEQAAKMTIGFEQLVGALSQIKGTDPSEALNAIVLAAAGNTRGLKQLGIAVDSASIKQEALKLGLISSTKDAVTPAIKAQSIFALATQNLGGFMEQARKHSGDLASQQRILSAEWANAKDQLGQALLPAVTKIAQFLATELPPALKAAGEAWDRFKHAFTDGKLEYLWNYIKVAARVNLGELHGIFDVFAGLFEGDWHRVGKGISEFFGALWKGIGTALRTDLKLLQNIFGALGDLILAGLKGAGSWLVGVGNDIIGGLLSGINTAWSTVTGFFGTVETTIVGYFSDGLTWLAQAGSDIITGLNTAITTAWTTVANWFATVKGMVVGFFMGAVSWLVNAGGEVISGLRSGVTAAWSTLAGWFSTVRSLIVGFFSTAISWLHGKGLDIVHGLEDGVHTAWTTVATWFRTLPTKIKDAVGDLSQVLFAAGVSLMRGFLSGIESMFNSIKNKLGSLAHDAVSWKGPPSYDAVVLYGNGVLMMQGFLNGLRSGVEHSVKPYLQGVASSLSLGGMSVGSVSAPAAAAAGGARAAGGKTVMEFHFHGSVYGGDKRRIAEELAYEMREAMVRQLGRTSGSIFGGYA